MIPKYRAFCKHHKCIEKVYSITYLGDDIKVEAECVSGFDFILMQSTGLFDKNGVEIFEGDVLRIHYTSGNDEIIKVVQVIYSDGAFRTNWHAGVFQVLGRNASAYTEVIGNIYENPELLEVNNDR